MSRQAQALLAVAALAAGCASSATLSEVRARRPEFQFPGVASSRQLEVARCIRDVLDQGIGDDAGILQAIERDPDAMHVIGRPDESPTSAIYDVAVGEDAITAKMAAASVVPPEMLRNAVATCVGTQGPR